MDPKCARDGEQLCLDCLEAGGACASCARSLAPRIAINRGWLKLIAAAAYQPSLPDPAAANDRRRAQKAEKKAARKAAELEAARSMRITTLIAGGFARVAHVHA